MAYVKNEAIKFYLQALVAKLYGLGMRQNLSALGACLYGVKNNTLLPLEQLVDLNWGAKPGSQLHVLTISLQRTVYTNI